MSGEPNTFNPELGEQFPMRVLVVDDELVNRRIVGLFFERCGYQADAAADGQEAVDAFKCRPYDLILMDLQMPVMDGLEAARQIRKLSTSANRPRIIALSAAMRGEEQEAALAAGMNAFLAKPLESSEFIETLSQAAHELAQGD